MGLSRNMKTLDLLIPFDHFKSQWCINPPSMGYFLVLRREMKNYRLSETVWQCFKNCQIQRGSVLVFKS